MPFAPLTPTQIRLLAIISFEELSPKDIAKRYKEKVGDVICNGTLYTILGRMLNRGLVSARDHYVEKDLRLAAYKITDLGTKNLQESRNFYAALVEFMVDVPAEV